MTLTCRSGEPPLKNADERVYTDVWASMGREPQAEERRKVFTPSTRSMQKLDGQAAEVGPLHASICWPSVALEVTDDVMDGPQSIVFQQAENRMHLAKGLLVWLLGGHHAS